MLVTSVLLHALAIHRLLISCPCSSPLPSLPPSPILYSFAFISFPFPFSITSCPLFIPLPFFVAVRLDLQTHISAMAAEIGVIDSFSLRHGVYATLAYFAIYLLMLLSQSATSQLLAREARKKGDKFVKYYNVSEPRMLRADRTVGNTLEQMGPFLCLYWLAIYVCSIKGSDASLVALSGYVYVIFRALYAPIWALSGSSARGIKPLILLATLPCYAVQAYCAYRLLMEV
eukprot:m.21160 g.21160  ORF g.21160 m.21160 type:complete len:230 (-) comp9041_c0_seq1:137-826(-)